MEIWQLLEIKKMSRKTSLTLINLLCLRTFSPLFFQTENKENFIHIRKQIALDAYKCVLMILNWRMKRLSGEGRDKKIIRGEERKFFV